MVGALTWAHTVAKTISACCALPPSYDVSLVLRVLSHTILSPQLQHQCAVLKINNSVWSAATCMNTCKIRYQKRVKICKQHTNRHRARVLMPMNAFNQYLCIVSQYSGTVGERSVIGKNHLKNIRWQWAGLLGRFYQVLNALILAFINQPALVSVLHQQNSRKCENTWARQVQTINFTLHCIEQCQRKTSRGRIAEIQDMRGIFERAEFTEPPLRFSASLLPITCPEQNDSSTFANKSTNCCVLCWNENGNAS